MCVLTPLLFVLYTISCQSPYEGHHVVKFAVYSPTLLFVRIALNITMWLMISFSGVSLLLLTSMSPKHTTDDCRFDLKITVVIPLLTTKNSWLRCFLNLGTLTDDKPTFMPQVDAVCNKAYQTL